MGQLVGPHKHLEIFFGSDIGTGFEENAVEATLGNDFRSHATACAGADDADIELFGRADYLGHFQLSVISFQF
jgi:hypothetical protein